MKNKKAHTSRHTRASMKRSVEIILE